MQNYNVYSSLSGLGAVHPDCHDLKSSSYWAVLSKAARQDVINMDQGSMFLFVGARTLLGAPGLSTRSKDATRGSWHRY